MWDATLQIVSIHHTNSHVFDTDLFDFSYTPTDFVQTSQTLPIILVDTCAPRGTAFPSLIVHLAFEHGNIQDYYSLYLCCAQDRNDQNSNLNANCTMFFNMETIDD